ncbi:MAG: DUF1244 domain-containing protein [Arenicellaceae bacterium]|nr:DUF1244 domain-containing protein [Arenicellaceae bacterium]
MDQAKQDKIQAAVFRRLVEHLKSHTDVQNLDLMITANFCRNCLSKWYTSAAEEGGEEVSYEEARELIYGMPYADWKTEYQIPATPEQEAIFEARRGRKLTN